MHFLDSNVLLYGFYEDPRTPVAQHLANQPFAISVQVLNEFAAVARGKLKRDWASIDERLAVVISLAKAISSVSLEIHLHGRVLAQRYGLQVYDGMIVAAALAQNCEILYSEDMHNGLIVEDRLLIINPFA